MSRGLKSRFSMSRRISLSPSLLRLSICQLTKEWEENPKGGRRGKCLGGHGRSAEGGKILRLNVKWSKQYYLNVNFELNFQIVEKSV